MATHNTEAHRALFEQGMAAKIRSQSGANSGFLTEEEHDDLVEILDGWDARPPAQRSMMTRVWGCFFPKMGWFFP